MGYPRCYMVGSGSITADEETGASLMFSLVTVPRRCSRRMSAEDPLFSRSRATMSGALSEVPEWKYARARYAAWAMVMMARKAERIEKRILMVVSGASYRGCSIV